MFKIIDKIVFVISIFIMLGLIGAYTASYINPNTFVIPSLLGLAYPYLLIANLIFFLYWLTRWKKMAWIGLAVVLMGIPSFMTYYGTASAEQTEEKADLSLLSYNVRYFDIYEWSKQKNTKEKLFNYLNKFEGDIICLQEFSTTDSKLKNQEIINRLYSYPNHYIYKDMAIFSRLSIIKQGYIPFDKDYTSSCIFCDIRVGKDTVRIYSIHLESYRLGKQERKFMKEITDGLKSKDITGGVKNITQRLIQANRNRATQAEQIKAKVENSPHKVILCGDFNDTPLSYTYKVLKSGLTDSFIQQGRGLGNTYRGEFPSFRIDFILHTPSIETISYTKSDIKLSDHYPIRCELKIKKST